jgi:ABC-type multidrug transport system fused ATPase/permease subunit
VWNRFYDNLTKLKNEGKISDEDIVTLIYFHLEQELAPITNPEEITPEFILEEIEKNKKKIEETTKEEITKEIKKITQRHREEITKKEQEFLNDLEVIKNDIKESVWKEANNKVNKRFIFGVLLLITVTVVSGILLFNKFKIGSILSFLLAFLQFLGFKIDILKIKEKQIKKGF